MKEPFEFKPMLLSESAPFSSEDYIFEPKIDGVRCIAYLSGKSVRLISRRGLDMTVQYPELAEIYKCADSSCVLDGEIAIIIDGRPDFPAIRRRFGARDLSKIATAARRLPAGFFAFDILEYGGDVLTGLPLMRRKQILSERITSGYNLDIVQFVETRGEELFALARARNLEGIVAKRKSGLYTSRRTHDWIKIRVPEYLR